MAILNPSPTTTTAKAIVNFCVRDMWSICTMRKAHADQKNCSYYETGASHCGCLRFDYHCDNWDAQHRIKEKK